MNTYATTLRLITASRAWLSPAFSTSTATALLFALCAVAYWPGTSGAGTTLRWAVLYTGAPLLWWGRGKIPWSVIAFYAYALISLTWSPFFLDGMLEVLRLGILICIMGIGRSLGSLTLILKCCTFGISLSSAVAIGQQIGYVPGFVTTVTGHPSGLFVNGNILAEGATLLLVGLLCDRCYLWALLCLPAALLPVSRASMIALAVVGMIWLASIMSRKSYLIVFAGLLVLATLMSIRLLNGYQTPALIFDSLFDRLQIWHATLTGITFWGHGAGSFRGLYPVYAAPLFDVTVLWPLHAHNDALELLFNYGAISTLVIIPFTALCIPPSQYRSVLIAAGIISLAGFPLFMPFSAAIICLCAGHCMRYWSPLFCAKLHFRGIVFIYSILRRTSDAGKLRSS